MIAGSLSVISIMEKTQTTTTRKITRFELPENLPDDPKVLKALLGEVCATAQHEIDDLLAQIAYLRSPRPSAPAFDPNQALFPFAQPPTEAPAPPAMEPAAGDAPAGKGHGRRPWPENLPREREEIAPPADAMKCRGCGGELMKIGEEVTPEIEYKPASYFIRLIVRPKFACVPCQGNVVIADLPPRPILKGRPGPGMLSHVVVAKYEWHQPLERQAAIMKSAGLGLAPTTLDGWIGAMADMYAPIWRVMRSEALASGLLNCDYTPVTVLIPGQEGTTAGNLGVNIGGGHVVFHYAPDKSAGEFGRFLDGFRGYLQCDMGSTNMPQASPEKGIVLVGCWQHARKYFKEAVPSTPSTATEALQWIKSLYRIEEQAKGMTPEERKALRAKESRPILEKFRTWLEVKKAETLPKSPVGEAIAYALRHWGQLNRYLEDGRLEIDNNVSERNLRCVGVGRRNWLFAGSDAGAGWAATLYSLVQSCKLHGIDAFEYFRDTLKKLPTHPARELTPKAWNAAVEKEKLEAGAVARPPP